MTADELRSVLDGAWHLINAQGGYVSPGDTKEPTMNNTAWDKINPEARPISYDELREGLHLVADGGFDCLAEGEINTVYRNSPNGFYIECNKGKHELEVQVSDTGELIGLRVLLKSIQPIFTSTELHVGSVLKLSSDPSRVLRRRIGGRMIQVLRETMINAKDGKKCLIVVMHESQKSAIEEFLKDFQFRNNITVKLHKRRMPDD